jgi:TRAP-type uncharacterized transport system substrate-binding protein
MRNRTFLEVLAGILALAALAAAVGYFALRPTVLRLAIPTTDTLDQRIFAAAADQLISQRAPIRLHWAAGGSSQAVTQALDRRDVDLAVIRSDAGATRAAETVLILRKDAVVVVVPKSSGIQKLTDLPGRVVGVVREAPRTGSLLDSVLDYYAVPHDKLTLVPFSFSDIPEALREKRIEAAVLTGPVPSRPMAEAVAAMDRDVPGGVQFIDVGEADAIAKRDPQLESIEVGQGAFSGRPALPAKKFTTIGFSVLLAGHNKVRADLVNELVRQLLRLRRSLSAVVPEARFIEAPDPEEDAALVIHRGVRAYLEGNETTWFDRYGDLLWIGIFALSGVGSAVAGLASRAGQRRRREALAALLRIEDAVAALPQARTAAEIDAIERRVDELSREAVARAATGELQAADIAAFNMALADARRRIAARRMTGNGMPYAAGPVTHAPSREAVT